MQRQRQCFFYPTAISLILFDFGEIICHNHKYIGMPYNNNYITNDRGCNDSEIKASTREQGGISIELAQRATILLVNFFFQHSLLVYAQIFFN